ncbi:hypothetical protein K1719_017486 [Acacia pycnantha]|nr:hypothetical protein K1719_017486 [Acacia pycnantha]
MEISCEGCSPRNRSDHLRKEGSGEAPCPFSAMELSDHGHTNQIQSMNAWKILKETVWILRYVDCEEDGSFFRYVPTFVLHLVVIVKSSRGVFCRFALSVLDFSPDIVVGAAVLVGLVFSVIFANAIIICDIAMVISVLEDVSGAQAMLRSNILIKGQTQVGLVIYLGSTIGMALVEALFEHRVKMLSYGDGSSRMWEGPLLVIMYSFVVLIDSMMSAVFYFSCRSFRSAVDASTGEGNSILETMAISAETESVQ